MTNNFFYPFGSNPTVRSSVEGVCDSADANQPEIIDCLLGIHFIFRGEYSSWLLWHTKTCCKPVPHRTVPQPCVTTLTFYDITETLIQCANSTVVFLQVPL